MSGPLVWFGLFRLIQYSVYTVYHVISALRQQSKPPPGPNTNWVLITTGIFAAQ